MSVPSAWHESASRRSGADTLRHTGLLHTPPPSSSIMEKAPGEALLPLRGDRQPPRERTILGRGAGQQGRPSAQDARPAGTPPLDLGCWPLRNIPSRPLPRSVPRELGGDRHSDRALNQSQAIASVALLELPWRTGNVSGVSVSVKSSGMKPRQGPHACLTGTSSRAGP